MFDKLTAVAGVAVLFLSVSLWHMRDQRDDLERQLAQANQTIELLKQTQKASDEALAEARRLKEISDAENKRQATSWSRLSRMLIPGAMLFCLSLSAACTSRAPQTILFMPPKELLRPATFPPTDNIKVNGDLVRYGRDCHESLLEIDNRMAAIRKYSEECERIAAENNR